MNQSDSVSGPLYSTPKSKNPFETLSQLSPDKHIESEISSQSSYSPVSSSDAQIDQIDFISLYFQNQHKITKSNHSPEKRNEIVKDNLNEAYVEKEEKSSESSCSSFSDVDVETEEENADDDDFVNQDADDSRLESEEEITVKSIKNPYDVPTNSPVASTSTIGKPLHLTKKPINRNLFPSFQAQPLESLYYLPDNSPIIRPRCRKKTFERHNNYFSDFEKEIFYIPSSLIHNHLITTPRRAMRPPQPPQTASHYVIRPPSEERTNNRSHINKNTHRITKKLYQVSKYIRKKNNERQTRKKIALNHHHFHQNSQLEALYPHHLYPPHLLPPPPPSPQRPLYYHPPPPPLPYPNVRTLADI